MSTNINPNDLSNLNLLDREDLIKIIHRMATGGVAVMFNGKRSAMEIQKKVRPRAVRTRKDLSFGTKEEQSENIILEGENLQGMVTVLYNVTMQSEVNSKFPFNSIAALSSVYTGHKSINNAAFIVKLHTIPGA